MARFKPVQHAGVTHVRREVHGFVIPKQHADLPAGISSSRLDMHQQVHDLAVGGKVVVVGQERVDEPPHPSAACAPDLQTNAPRAIDA